MTMKAGVFRTKESLVEQKEALKVLRARFENIRMMIKQVPLIQSFKKR